MRALAIAAAVLLGAGCSIINPKPKPPDPPQPTPIPPPASGAIRSEMLLRQTPAAKLTNLAGQPVDLRMAVQCCGFQDGDEWNSKLPGVENHRWPLISGEAMDYFSKYAFNAFHMRFAPFYGDPQHEALWSDTGGPVKNDGSPNEAFFAEVDKAVAHAAAKGWWLELNTTDTWLCKHCQWGDQPCQGWSAEAIDSCGRRPNPEVERFIRFVVARYSRFGNVIWLIDNEGSEIQGARREWFEWARDVIRDEELKDSSKHVHLIGTNSDFTDLADYVATHARAALTVPVDGRWTLNNERNPEFSPEQEASNFRMAREAGLSYAFWRAEMNESKMVRTLELMKGVVDGSTPSGCFPPAEDDPLWVEPPQAGVVGSSMRPALEQAKSEMGEKCGRVDGQGSVHGGALETLDELGQHLRKNGECAGRMTDSVFIKTPEGKWQEFHAVAFSTGCWANDPAQLPKNTWTYGGQGPSPGCTNPPPPANGADHCIAKEHTKGPNWTTLDATFKVHDQAYCASIGSPNVDCPVRLEGDPQREACEAAAVGSPAWSGPGEPDPSGNPYLWRVQRGVSGTVTTCSSLHPSVCCSTQVTP